jgi:CRISPR-associated protein Csm1
MNDKNRLKFAALLHDIGKLAYRAGQKGKHEEIGRIFIDSFEDVLAGISGLISMHHGESEIFLEGGRALLKYLIIGDWLASSERIGKTQQDEVKEIGLSPIFSKVSIYPDSPQTSQEFYYMGEKLTLEGSSEEIFPIEASEIKGELHDNFKGNWDYFKEKFAAIKDIKEEDNLFEYLYSLLRQCFKFIPSAAYQVEPDISLFDHSKMVCALAIALFNYFEGSLPEDSPVMEQLNLLGQILKQVYVKGRDYIDEIQNDSKKRQIYQEQPFFSLIHGDFSGIQAFIHMISSKYAMKTLKGRSFFLDLLTDNISLYVAQQLQLTRANIIFAGGGHFYLIGHYSEDIESILRSISIKTNSLFIDRFNANLYLALDYIPFTIEDILSRISDGWRRVNQHTSEKKKKKFEAVLRSSRTDYFSKIFGPDTTSAEKSERCIICNSYKQLEHIVLEEGEMTEKWCAQCKSFRELTDDLRNIKFCRVIPKGTKWYNEFFNEYELAFEFAHHIGANEQLKWDAINSPGKEGTLGFKLLSIAFPLEDSKDPQKDHKKIIDSDDLADAAFQSTGYNKLGVVKMDVDSLGQIIQRGLGQDATLSRVSTISSSLSLFFKGYVPQLIHSKYDKAIYLIFSGGDDLFALGAWDKLLEFTYDLYRAFRTFTAYNQDITLSAGITIESPKFPIIKASMKAEDELDKAKHFESYTGKTNTKNKICIFGMVLSWDWSMKKEKKRQEISKKGISLAEHHRDLVLTIMNQDNAQKITDDLMQWFDGKSEFELSIILKDIFVYLIENKQFSKSMLRKIGDSVKGMQKLISQSLEGTVKVPRLWRLKYYLRSVLSSKDLEVRKLSTFISLMFEIVVKNNLFKHASRSPIKNVDFISVAVTWADYLTRT